VGIANSGLIFLLGLLMSQFTLTGYDASAHMTEETKDAAKSGPRGIILTVGVSFVAGWMYLLSLTFSIQVGWVRACPGAACQALVATSSNGPVCSSVNACSATAVWPAACCC
jgi:amino acid transporter